MTSHLLPDDLLLSYAAGTLDEGQLLVAACHLEFHPELRPFVRDAERIGGALLQELPDCEMKTEVLSTVLSRLGQTSGAPPSISGGGRDRDLPRSLAAFIGGGYDRLRWRFLGPGLRHALVWRGQMDEKVWLLRGEGGRIIPEHGHAGEEWTLVLKGAYHSMGQRYGVGDLELADVSMQHSPAIDPAESCICLAYTKGRIVPESRFVRIVQPLIGL